MPSLRDWGGALLRAACLALPFALFAYVAFGAMPAALVLEIHFKNPVIVLLLGLFLFLAYRQAGRWGVLCGLAATLLVFAVELAGVWLAAESDGNFLIGGLLPWSDAEGYYTGAQLLAEGGQLTPWHGRRPWFIGLLGVLLELTQGNLQWSIAALVAAAALACFALARTLQAGLGAVPAVAALLVLLLFYTRFIGTTMSEQLGLPLGALGLAVLWQSAQQPRLGLAWAAGLWLLTVALAARPGAFFVLPALLLWGAWHAHRGVARREPLKVLFLGGGAIGLGFILDASLRRMLVPGALPFGNFSYTLYGLVAGNKGWLQARHDHPEILDMGETEAARHVYELALAALRADPMSAVSGAMGAWRDYFSFGGYGLFSFISMPALQWAALILAALGLVNCLWHWRNASCSMTLAMAAGVVLSVPFVPPVDAHSMRIYAAMIPLSALLVAAGAALVPGMARHAQGQDTAKLQMLGAACGAALVLVAFIGTIGLRLLGTRTEFAPAPCPPGHASLYVRLTGGSSLRLIEDGQRARSRVPDIRFSDFSSGLESYRRWYPDLYAELQMARAGQEVRPAINLSAAGHGEPLWLINNLQDKAYTGVAQICALPAGDPARRFYYAQDMRRVDGASD
jgi:hypothetical protein